MSLGFILEIVRLGLKNLRLHMLRSVLTSLGIILGVAAVIIMVSIGEGKKQDALREIEVLGATNVIVRSFRPAESRSFGGEQRSFVAKFGLKREDLRRIEHFIDDAAGIVALKSVGDETSYADKRMISQTFGTTPGLQSIANLTVERGRYLSDDDIERRTNVAVIGADVAKQFFPMEDPLGKEFRIGSSDLFRVVGVLRPIGLAGGTGSALVGRDLNDDIHIPITTAEVVFSDTIFRRQSGSFSGEEVEISEIYVMAPNTESVLSTAERVDRILRAGHPELEDVELIVPWELLESAKRTARMMNILLVTIAGISLLVGGIGIMNIMLASVTERTREIGIRRALGATKQNIVLQFLVETGSLSAIGGIVGIGLGVGVAIGYEVVGAWVIEIARDYFDTSPSSNTQVTGWSIIASFIVATATGLVFGIYPAIVAARQDPIVALRHD